MKWVILDDDPTGTQTVSGVVVLTEWSVPSLRDQFAKEAPGFFILTNSRALNPSAAEQINREIAENLKHAAEGRKFQVISRSDSTLRGHFPLETDVLNECLGPFDGTILIPYFEAGGRVTIDDIHYVREGERMIPAAETPFARDRAFGFSNSNLRDYVEEKTGGRVKRDDVVSIPAGLAADEVAERLGAWDGHRMVIVNASTPEELDRFCEGLHMALKSGRRFVYRTAAEFVRVMLGQKPGKLLCGKDMGSGQGGGLVIAGSYVPKTTAQLSCLLADPKMINLEVHVGHLLTSARDAEILRISDSVNHHLRVGDDVLVMTSRGLVGSDDPAESLKIGKAVSDALVSIVRGLAHKPAWLIAKGGITSSDVATKGLGVRCASVLGQLLPGVPVWKCGAESKFPEMCYVIFPGNVGRDDSLLEAVRICRNRG